MNIQNALNTQGWMTESELRWLAKQASSRRMIAEIGSYLGRSTRALADNTPGTVYAIDTWLGSEEHQSDLCSRPADWLFEGFKHNTSDLLNLCAVRMPSVEAAVALKDLRFDLIFLDASHDYENVRADILAWRPLLSPDGLLCGHDYGPTWIGVNQAVNELIPNHKIAQNEIWYAA